MRVALQTQQPTQFVRAHGETSRADFQRPDALVGKHTPQPFEAPRYYLLDAERRSERCVRRCIVGRQVRDLLVDAAGVEPRGELCHEVTSHYGRTGVVDDVADVADGEFLQLILPDHIATREDHCLADVRSALAEPEHGLPALSTILHELRDCVGRDVRVRDAGSDFNRERPDGSPNSIPRVERRAVLVRPDCSSTRVAGPPVGIERRGVGFGKSACAIRGKERGATRSAVRGDVVPCPGKPLTVDINAHDFARRAAERYGIGSRAAAEVQDAFGIAETFRAPPGGGLSACLLESLAVGNELVPSGELVPVPDAVASETKRDGACVRTEFISRATGEPG